MIASSRKPQNVPSIVIILSYVGLLWVEQIHGQSTRASSPHEKKGVEIVVTYSDVHGNVRTRTVKASDLSSSWVWTNPNGEVQRTASRADIMAPGDSNGLSPIHGRPTQKSSPLSPIKQKRKELRKRRAELRASALARDAEIQGDSTRVEGGGRGYSVWRREYSNLKSDSLLRLMHDQIIMAKVYASIARSKNHNRMYDSLMAHIRSSQKAIGESNADSELHPRSLDRAKAMGHIITSAKEKFSDCAMVARKLRAMVQSAEENVNAQKRKSSFLIQQAAKTIPRSLNCLALRLSADHHLTGRHLDFPHADRLGDQSLYHYAIFSDNVLATSVVLNSTAANAARPEKHVFHIVTDGLNYAAMRMWFLANTPDGVAVEVQNVDGFKWLNASYCPALRQLESASMRDFYFNVNRPTTVSAGADSLKYRNPKYLSMLNHLRFYLPQVYPNLDRILFLDDDVVVQKDLSPLWSVDLAGMVNGAVETCKGSFHTFDKYLNFSDPLISKNFDPSSCAWAFGMNMFDLLRWRQHDITGIYHHWQNLNEDRTLWKLGSLPPGLITFDKLTRPLDRGWHVLGLGYDPALNLTEIDRGAVIHYNGNYKPWLDLAVSRYRSYWSKYLMPGNPYLSDCNIIE